MPVRVHLNPHAKPSIIHPGSSDGGWDAQWPRLSREPRAEVEKLCRLCGPAWGSGSSGIQVPEAECKTAA